MVGPDRNGRSPERVERRSSNPGELLRHGTHQTAVEFLNAVKGATRENLILKPFTATSTREPVLELDPERTKFFPDGVATDTRVGAQYGPVPYTDYVAYVDVVTGGMHVAIPYKSTEDRS